ncbi:hypothetical protein FRC19_003840 [Serendipita sp. 401]|nr:hypothetical protein FRC16_008239 [Serendipita sp. 398]KAG8828501.1 hypothetical protein FRC19_003840 [Serendipita sp. 401]KAG9058145.1 hypothetical protein FS842_001329 [Serendipita sp. 407]
MVKTVIVDDMDPNIVYGGDGWVAMNQPYSVTTNDFNSTLHHASINGLTIRYPFRGTGITVYGTISLPCCYGTPGSTYSIDGGTPVRFNSSGEVSYPDPKISYSHIPFYRSPQLSYGDHSILITVDNVSDAAKRRYFFDFFLVNGVEDNDNAQGSGGGGGPGYTIVDDRDSRVSYPGGGWSLVSGSSTSTDYMGTSTTSPSSTTATSMFSFTGTSISVYAHAFDNYGTGNIAQFVVDAGTSQEIVRYATVLASTDRRHHPFLVLEGLTDGAHTIQVTTLTQKKWWLDYFVYGTSTGAGVGGLNNAVVGGVTTGGGGGSTPNTGSGTALPEGEGATGSVASTNVTIFMSNGVMVTSTQTISNTGLVLPSPFTTDPDEGTSENNPAIGSSSSATQSPPQTKTATIAGATIGAVAFLSLLVFLVLYGLKRRAIKTRQSMLEHEGTDAEKYTTAGSGSHMGISMGRSGGGGDGGTGSTRSTTPLRNLAGVGILQGNGDAVTIDGGDDELDRMEYVQRPNRLAPPLAFPGKSKRDFPRDVRQSSGTISNSLLESESSLRSSTNDPSSIVPPITTTNRDSQMQNGVIPYNRDGYVLRDGMSLVEEEEEGEEGYGRRGVAPLASPSGQRSVPAWVAGPNTTEYGAGTGLTNELMEKARFLRSQSMQRNSTTQGESNNPRESRQPPSSPHQQEAAVRVQQQQRQRNHRGTRPATERAEEVGNVGREIDGGVRLDPLTFNLTSPDLLPPSYSATTYR